MDAKIVSKKPVTLPQLAKIVQGVGKKDDRLELQNKVLEFAKKSAKLSEADAEKLFAEVSELEITGLSPEHIAQMVDILPKDLGDIKSVLSGTKATISPENFNKIHDIIKKYAK